MTPDETPHGGQRSKSSSGRRLHVDEKTLKTDTMQIERKTFVFTLKENLRGRFLRITEDVNGWRDTIIVPASGLDEFGQKVCEMAKVAKEGEAPPPST
jgi:hypothetical protein